MSLKLWNIFERLADDIESRLKREVADHVSGAAEAALQAFATELMAFDRSTYLRLLMADAGRRMRQTWPNDYGDPTFTIVRRSSFRIELIFWDQPFNPPHDHVSCGAFLALHGDRLNRDFEYHRLHAVSDTLSSGELREKRCEYMQAGDTHYIQPEMIHDMFWIDLPVTTVAVRCVGHPAPLDGPPRSYLGGGLATVRPRFRENATLNTLRRGLKLLMSLDHSRLDMDVVSQLAKKLPLGDYVYLVADSARIGKEGLMRMVDAIPAERLNEFDSDAVARLRASIGDISLRQELAKVVHSVETGPTRLALGFLWLGQNSLSARQIVSDRGLSPSEYLPVELDKDPRLSPFQTHWTGAVGSPTSVVKR